MSTTLTEAARSLGRGVEVSPLELLAERAGIAGLQRNGDVSCGGATHLLPARDGWLAVSLPRADDRGMVPAWLELDGTGTDDVWDVVASAVRDRSAAELEGRGAELGLAVAQLPVPAPAAVRSGPELGDLPCRAEHVAGPLPPPKPLADIVVMDLSSLWAGPLCGSLLVDAGCDVIKVESIGRPDGSRAGPTAFFDLMNGGKRGVAIDIPQPDSVAILAELLRRADIVIEGSRPRALQQMGIDPVQLVSAGGPRVWISITGHGRTGPGANRVAFGDDAAVAGGLVSWDRAGPCFCADAVADPVAGLVAAAAALRALDAGGRWILDVALANVAAAHSGPTLAVPPDLEAAAAVPRSPRTRGPRVGEHTAAVLSQLGIAR